MTLGCVIMTLGCVTMTPGCVAMTLGEIHMLRRGDREPRMAEEYH